MHFDVCPLQIVALTLILNQDSAVVFYGFGLLRPRQRENGRLRSDVARTSIFNALEKLLKRVLWCVIESRAKDYKSPRIIE
jgi:hypothetical protein